MESIKTVATESIIDKRHKERRKQDADRMNKRQWELFKKSAWCGLICLAIYFAGFASIVSRELAAIGTTFSGALFAFYMGRFIENAKLVG
jgi:hypothetical protein